MYWRLQAGAGVFIHVAEFSGKPAVKCVQVNIVYTGVGWADICNMDSDNHNSNQGSH